MEIQLFDVVDVAAAVGVTMLCPGGVGASEYGLDINAGVATAAAAAVVDEEEFAIATPLGPTDGIIRDQVEQIDENDPTSKIIVDEYSLPKE